MIDVLRSKQNPKIKFLYKLKKSSNRKKFNVFLVEGLRELSRANDAQVVVEIYFCRSKFSNIEESNQFLSVIMDSNIAIFEVTDNVYDKISLRENGNGWLGLCRAKSHQLSEIKLSPAPILIALENIEKPNNFGAIIRTADSVGADGVIILNNSIEVFNPNAIRNSQGAIFFVNIYHTSNEELIKFSEQNNLNIFITTPQCEHMYFEENFIHGGIFLMGSESTGVSDFWLKHSKFPKIKIPQFGKSDSLNVSVATAIVVYEAARQQYKK